PRTCVEARHMRGRRVQPCPRQDDPRIGVKSTLMRGRFSNIPEFSKSHAYAWSPTHMRGKRKKQGQNHFFVENEV
ncbi:hypothetical protein PIB30_103789, partial [Stylosanthes scabra]|nr:hypothetical protein [Stylosanthes scabra]